MFKILLKTALFGAIAPGSVIVYIPYLLVSYWPKWQVINLGPLMYLGPVVFALGLGVSSLCAWGFVNVGKGTPAPIDPPLHLVTCGLYRFVRNPMYIGILTMLVGEALFFESIVLMGYACVVFLVFHFFVVLYEEWALRRKFGDSYRRYCDTVPRWIPRRPGRSI